MKFPIFNSFKAESYLKAFLLNGLIARTNYSTSY